MSVIHTADVTRPSLRRAGGANAPVMIQFDRNIHVIRLSIQHSMSAFTLPTILDQRGQILNIVQFQYFRPNTRELVDSNLIHTSRRVKTPTRRDATRRSGTVRCVAC